jgi:hypothetical protein
VNVILFPKANARANAKLYRETQLNCEYSVSIWD